MQMPAAVESVGGSVGQSKSQFTVSEGAPLWDAASSWAASSWKSSSQWGQSQSQFAVTESAPTGACGPFQASGWATLAEKQKKC